MKNLFTILSVLVSTYVFSQCQDTINFNISLYSKYNDTIVLKQNIKAAAKAQYICVWGDESRMELNPNGKIYQFRKGLSDGMYIAFFDKNYKDTAMVAVIENGELNGVMCRWNNGHIEEICEYKDGLKNGWRKLYLYMPEYGTLINIQKCKDGACIEVHTEW